LPLKFVMAVALKPMTALSLLAAGTYWSTIVPTGICRVPHESHGGGTLKLAILTLPLTVAPPALPPGNT